MPRVSQPMLRERELKTGSLSCLSLPCCARLSPPTTIPRRWRCGGIAAIFDITNAIATRSDRSNAALLICGINAVTHIGAGAVGAALGDAILRTVSQYRRRC